MLDEQGRFHFTGEVLDLVEGLWCTYRETRGCSQNRLERLAGLVYIVAALRQDVDAIWSQLLALPHLEGVNLAEALAEALGETGDAKAEMQRRGWLD